MNESVHLVTATDSHRGAWDAWQQYKVQICHTRDTSSTPESHVLSGLGNISHLTLRKKSNYFQKCKILP